MLAALDLTTPDLIVMGVCALFAVRGAWKGFAWQAVRTIGLVLALFGATQWYAPVSDWMIEKFAFIPDTIAPVVAWLGVVVAIFIVITYLAHLARGAIRSADLHSLDRILGFALGAAMGLIFCAIGFVMWGSMQDSKELNDDLAGSISVKYMAHAMRTVKPLFPEQILDRWGSVLSTLDEVAPLK